MLDILLDSETMYRVDKIALKLPRKSKEAVKHRIHLLEVYKLYLVAEYLLNSDTIHRNQAALCPHAPLTLRIRPCYASGGCEEY